MSQVLREFNHVNPQDDEEGKEFLNTRVSIRSSSLSKNGRVLKELS